MTKITEIAEAVKLQLNTVPPGTFSVAFGAVRAFAPVYELAELNQLRVTVVPKAMSRSLVARNCDDRTYQIDIGIQRRIDVDDPAEVDVYMALTEEIANWLTRRKLDAAPDAVWVGLENEPIFAPDHLMQQRVFTSVITLTYRVLT